MPSKTKISTYMKELTPCVLLESIIDNLKAFPKFVWQIVIEALLVPGFREEWGDFQKWRPDAEPHHGTEERHNRKKKRRLLKQKASFYYRYDFFNDKYRGHPHDHENCARVKFNVGGRIFETQLRTLGAFPHTLLGDPERRLAFYDSTTQMYYLDRSRGGFEAILYFYQSGGRIRRPDELSVDDFLDELLFYDLGEDVRHDFIMAEGLWEDETTKILPRNLFQRKIWLLFEYPESSVQSYIVAIMSVMTITASISAFCMETMPMFKENELKRMTLNRSRGDGDDYGDYDETNLLDIFNLVEIICVSWFGLEFLARLLSCPKKIAFITDMMNIVDFIAIVPFFVQVSSTQFGSSDDAQTKKGINQAAYLSIIRVIRLVRVFRILKLSRHSTGLQILGLTLQASIRELSLLIFFLMIGVVLFSSAVYFAEQGSSSLFPSIPTSFYWGVVTMTTVGYGDMVPTTPLGKIIGTITAVSGVLTIALPVPVIVSNFNFFYHRATGKANKKNYSNPDHVRMCPFLPGNGVHPDIAEKVQKVRAKDKFGYDSEISVDGFESPRTASALEAAGDFKGRRRRRSSVSRRIHESSKRYQESDNPQYESDSSFAELKFENRKQKKK